jgi:hypothetical protein
MGFLRQLYRFRFLMTLVVSAEFNKEVCMATGTMVNRQAFQAEPHDGDPFPLVESDSGRLRVIVVFTTIEGTLAALTLLVSQEVYYRYPLETPPVSASFLHRLCVALIEELKIEELQLDTDAINIDIRFCRQQEQCLQFTLKPRSVVVIGVKKRWWRMPERKLERALKQMGHDVLHVDAAASDYKVSSKSVIHRLGELMAKASLR